MTPTGVLLVTPIFRRGSGSLSLLQGPSRVALALHKARCGTPLGVTTESLENREKAKSPQGKIPHGR